MCIRDSVVAERRPSTAIQFGTGVLGVAVVLIVVIFLIRFIVPLLATESDSAGHVVATYVSTTWPLIGVMIRLAILGLIIAAVGGVAKLIWPDDWVYSSVSDDRGVRSIRHRRSKKDDAEPQPVQQVPVAAAVPYPGYPQVPYGAYPPQPQWGQPYPGQYPPGYGYPVGPYAQPQPMPQQYASPGRPTVPVLPVGEELVPPAAPPLDNAPGDLPADAAQIVPQVVATTSDSEDSGHSDAGNSGADDSDPETTSAVETVVADVPASTTSNGSTSDADADADADDDIELASDQVDDATSDDEDSWAAESDW